MKLKILLFIGFFLMRWLSLAQFKSPEQTITAPEIILPEQQLDHIKLFGKPLKTKMDNKTTTVYDKNGNIISETTRDVPFTFKSIYTYKKNVLIEKITTITTDSVELKRLNAKSLREASRESLGQTESVVAVYDYRNDTRIYKAILGKKNRVASYSDENNRYNYITKKQIKTQYQYNITYDNNKIVEINSENSKEKYYYENKKLIKKETVQGNENEIEEYLYDKNENLINIKYKKWSVFNDKIFNQSYYIKDSAVYNNNNKIIWKGNKARYTTYKYDENENIIERLQYANGKKSIKEEFFYDNSLMNKVDMTIYKDGSKENNILTTNYTYQEGKLKEYHQKNSYSAFEKKSVYEYDEYNRIKKITELVKYSNKSGADQFKINDEQKFFYTLNSLTIQKRYDSQIKYEFY